MTYKVGDIVQMQCGCVATIIEADEYGSLGEINRECVSDSRTNMYDLPLGLVVSDGVAMGNPVETHWMLGTTSHAVMSSILSTEV